MATALSLCVLLLANTANAAKPNGSVTIPAELREQLASFDLSSTESVDVIVQLAGTPAALVSASERPARLNQIHAERGNLFSHLRRNGINVSPKHEFDQVYVGFTLTLPANQLPVLAAVPGVTGIYPNVEVSREDMREDAVMNVSPELAGSTLKIGAPAAWNLGYRGAGIVVAILDDGVDYTHPDLGGCTFPGPSCKVIAGYDFIDLDADPINGWTTTTTQNPAPAPPTVTRTRDYHGSHVAATAAGTKGVAPEAKILAVRVLGQRPDGTNTNSNLGNIMAGVEYAVRNHADVINMSIGIQNFHAQAINPWSEVTANAVRSGVVWVNSNGNDGPLPYKPNVYGSSPHVIATGNADARGAEYPRTMIPATGEALIGGAYGTEFPASLLNTPLEVVHVGFGNTPAYYAGKNVAGKIVLALRGAAEGEDGTFVNKGQQAKDAGAAALIVYNDAARSVDFVIPALAVPSFSLSYPNAQKVLANPSIVVQSFQPGTQMNSGSSRGPTPDLQIKPDVSAPGTDIVAAVPFEVSPTGYAALNGTSMAAPHVAGAAALLRQAHPDWNPYQIKAALMNTATNLTDLAGLSYRTIDQGAGIINIQRALAPSLSVNQPSLGFGQLMPGNNYTATRTLDVQANGVYNVSATFIRNWAGVSVTTSANSVFSGASTIGVTVTSTANVASGEYEGYVTFVNTADANDTYRVPFLFVHNVPVSEVSVSKMYVISHATIAPNERVNVSFNAGRPLVDWYLGTVPSSTGAHTRLSLNQGAAAAGTKTFAWPVRAYTTNAQNQTVVQTLGAGTWSVGVFYKLAGEAQFTFSGAYARVYVDKTAPLLVVETALPSLTNTRVVVVRGAVADSGFFSWGETGGWVLVNGQKADLFPRVPATAFAASHGLVSELAFEIEVTLAEGQNSITVYAEDASGNRSTQTVNLATTLDSIAPLSAASTTPAPNAAGWNNSAATLAITASDGGSGVKSIEYSINGVATTVNAAAASVSFTADGQYAVSFFATDVAGNVETSKSHNVWLDATAPVIAFAGNGSYTVDQTVSVTCSASDNLSGVGTTNCSSALLSKDAWQLSLGATVLAANATDVAGNAATANATVTISVTFDSLSNVAVRFAAGALGSSLESKLDAAEDASARGNVNAANAQLVAFQSEVAAQSGKAIATDLAQVLVRLAEALKK
ncbi:MAG TPA: S8 family serine peptidase [Thermoanaerobaculia bacterium]